MDVKPSRPSRAIRPRQDENIVPATKSALNQKAAGAVNTLAAMGPTNQPAVIKAAARRAFGDVSNVAKPVVASKGQKENATEKPGKVVLHPKEQIAVRDAISKPAQRNAIRAASATATSTLAKQPMGGPPRRVVKKTAVYEDKRPSPPKAKSRSPRGRVSPRGKNGAIIRRESRQIGPIQPAAKTAPVAQAPALKKTKSDIPTFSDQPSQTYLRGETASVAVTEEEYDEDATDVEDFRTPTAAITDDEEYDYDEEEDEEEYSSARSRPAGDNTTTNVTQTVHLLPKYTAEDKKKLTAASKEYSGIDEDDMWDITMVAEYGDDIFEYMKELEMKMLPNPSYMEDQPDIQWSMRAILMDWLVQVHHRFGLLPETLFLCSNYIDRFLSSKVVSLGKLQLVGATALFLAAKYEEIQCPSVHEIVFMVDSGYTVEEILKAERFMLSMLNYELGWPGPMSFLRRVSKADDYDLETRTLAKYFLEITIMDERFVGSPPSFLAAGAHYFARLMLKKGSWTPAHTYFSGFTAEQLHPLIKTMSECCENPKEHHAAIFDKYQDRRYKRASLFVENWVANGGTLDSLLS